MFQDDNDPVLTSRCVQAWLHEHYNEMEYLTWCPESPYLNIIEPLWVHIRDQSRGRFKPPSTFEPGTAQREEWVQISMNFVQDFCLSIPHRIQAVIQTKGGPTPY